MNQNEIVEIVKDHLQFGNAIVITPVNENSFNVYTVISGEFIQITKNK